MPKNPYEFRLKLGANYFYVNSSGVVATTTDPTEALLEASVVDWDKLELQWKRSTEYHGIFSRRTPDTVRFANDAATILRHLYYTAGSVDAECTFEVKRLKSTDQLYYSEGDFDCNFALFSSTKDFVDVALIESGQYTKLISQDDVDLAITLGEPGVDPDTRYILMDGVKVLGKINYQTVKDYQQVIGTNCTLPLAFVNVEGPYIVGVNNGASVFNTEWEGGDFDSAYHWKFTQACRAKLSVDFSFDILFPGDTIELWIDIRDKKPDVDLLHTEMIYGPIDTTPGGLVHVVGSMADYFDFNTENYAILYWKRSGVVGVSPTLKYRVEPNTAIWDFEYTQPATVTRSIGGNALFRKLIFKATGGDAWSSLLTDGTDSGIEGNYDLDASNVYYTCGDALRQLPTAEGVALGDGPPSIKTTVRQFRRDAFYSLCAGLGIEEVGGDRKVVLEHLSHFYQKDSLICTLGKRVRDYKLSSYNDYRMNNLKAGYPDQNYDEANGRFEFNSQVSYRSTQRTKHEDADYTSPYRTDCYGMEYTRANLSNKKTTDNGSDNDVFKIFTTGTTSPVDDVTPDPLVIQRGQVITAGIPATVRTTLFNVAFTPDRNLGRMLPFLRSVHYGLTAPLLKFELATKNGSFVGTQFTFSYPIYRDIDVSSDGSDILWIPNVLEVEAELPVILNSLMSANPYGVIGLTLVKGNTEKYVEWFILEAGVNTGVRQSHSLKLLQSPNTPDVQGL